jgi:hypothetical protein
MEYKSLKMEIFTRVNTKIINFKEKVIFLLFRNLLLVKWIDLLRPIFRR